MAAKAKSVKKAGVKKVKSRLVKKSGSVKSGLVKATSVNTSNSKNKSNSMNTSNSAAKNNKKGAKERYLITAALPYANGPIHIGHMLEYIQADIYSRFLKLSGKDALYICASDMHGTPIEVNAQKAGIEPLKFANKFWKEHQEDFASFLIKFDNYYKTHSKENQELSEYFFTELKKKKFIYTKKINIIYCDNCQRSLPDRYVKGMCPHCSTKAQYGDICESCSSILKGADLIDPKCVLCGKTPKQQESEHYFFSLSKFSQPLKKWINSEEAEIQPEIRNWLNDWLKKGLDDWCISRDAPYFGFEIPDSKKETGQKKYFYVWMDAPIGYISSTRNYCEGLDSKNKNRCSWEDYWKKGQVKHFIGKDIVYFHYLFWPAMFLSLGWPLPKLNTHGFITVNGQKMSKSRGTFFTAKDFLKLYPAESLRFYYAQHLDKHLVDIDLNFEDFTAVNNNILMGSLGNFCYRVLTFAEKNYSRVRSIAQGEDEKAIMEGLPAAARSIEELYNDLNFKMAVKEIMKIVDLGNAYFQKAEPWKNKESNQAEQAVGFCVNLARNISILVQPVLPEFSEKVWKALGEKDLKWKDMGFSFKGQLKKPEMLVQKIEKVPEKAKFPLCMKVGKVLEVNDHPNADALYLLKVDFGADEDGKEDKRQVVAGLKKYFKPEELKGKKAVFCVNMKKAKIRGEMSGAMILVADDTKHISLLDPGQAEPGTEVKLSGMESSDKEVTIEEFQSLRMLVVKKGEEYSVEYEGHRLVTAVGEISVKGVKEGAGIF